MIFQEKESTALFEEQSVLEVRGLGWQSGHAGLCNTECGMGLTPPAGSRGEALLSSPAL